ncbi:hydantoinase/oxoprolinase family protein [Aurantimonas endophytica]|uniref:Putative H4MPT-linked C1 transfer pathway protein n=1 Tax=Aurantimonas endophytica TaxID=1522175 RepID=A0A7W6MPT0_9HYPH|nr:hydantoinase/oxoprolinase family protein [Aurantimonas endophytica]MBB4003345.1 putative H4MPT-linked C1 transfer pathway protein [Aurantimonas endophytica]MCO6404206.1 S-layer protein [Aurantimonas endophytica]
MTRVLGWDVGGAHLKAALADGDRIVKVWQEPSPIWQGLDRLDDALATILAEVDGIDRHAVTMTGELSDIFSSRSEGVAALTRLFAEKLPGDVAIYAGAAGFVRPEAAGEHVAHIASANWHASATLAAGAIEEALFLDMGSTTTDILPVAGGTVRATAATDAERLAAGELVYQGFTRTALMAVASEVPFAGRLVPVMNEFFASMADVQRVVGTLDEADDLYPAADGQAKTLEGSRRRLARMIGMDAEDGTDGAWEWLAHAFAEAQVRRIHDAALRVLSREDLTDDAPVVIAGAGRPVLRRLAARLDRGVVDFSDLLDCPAEKRDAVCRAAPAAALALLAARRG